MQSGPAVVFSSTDSSWPPSPALPCVNTMCEPSVLGSHLLLSSGALQLPPDSLEKACTETQNSNTSRDRLECAFTCSHSCSGHSCANANPHFMWFSPPHFISLTFVDGTTALLPSPGFARLNELFISAHKTAHFPDPTCCFLFCSAPISPEHCPPPLYMKL